jgi:hypothetical protein
MKIDIGDDAYKLVSQQIGPLEELGQVLDEIYAAVTLLVVARDIQEHMGGLKSRLTPMGLYGAEWEDLAATTVRRIRTLLGEEPGEEPRGIALELRRAIAVQGPTEPAETAA